MVGRVRSDAVEHPWRDPPVNGAKVGSKRKGNSVFVKIRPEAGPSDFVAQASTHRGGETEGAEGGGICPTYAPSRRGTRARVVVRRVLVGNDAGVGGRGVQGEREQHGVSFGRRRTLSPSKLGIQGIDLETPECHH